MELQLAFAGSSARVFRLLLLSCKDIGTPEMEQRMERLEHLNGGRDIAIVFLLAGAINDENPMGALMKLQLS
jgi:hypothetical protein